MSLDNLTAADMLKTFLSVPGSDLVDKLLIQLQSVPQLQKIFGDAKTGSWANYNRMDWPTRSLPAMNVYESSPESQTSDHSYITGSIQIAVYWPGSFRRDDATRVPNFFKGALQAFFTSKYIKPMLDEWYQNVRPEKVYGLNELGKTLTWSPNVEGITDTELVPVTIVDVGYRIDLRAWERALEFEGRTRDDPFEVSLADLEGIDGDLDAVNDNGAVIVSVPVSFETNNGD